MKRIIGILCALVISIATVQSQELSIYVGGGLSGKSVSIDQENSLLKLGGRVGISYTYLLHTNWGILSGVEMSWYKNEINIDNYTHQAYAVDDINSAFEYKTTASSYMESSSFTSINIPLMLQYKTHAKVGFYANMGAKLFFPMKETNTQMAENIQLKGYYPDTELLIDNLPQHGFGTINHLESTTKNALKSTVILSTELGIVFSTVARSNLYTGIYIDYGLTDIQADTMVPNTEKVPVVDYSTKGLDKVQLNTLSKGNTAKIMSVGIQVRYGLGR